MSVWIYKPKRIKSIRDEIYKLGEKNICESHLLSHSKCETHKELKHARI